MKDGWYWVKVRAFKNYYDGFHEKWIIVHFAGWWRWDMELLRREQLHDMTSIIETQGPIEREVIG